MFQDFCIPHFYRRPWFSTWRTGRRAGRISRPLKGLNAMLHFTLYLRRILTLVVALVAAPNALADEKPAGWKLGDAERYLDEREKTWLEFPSAKRGEGSGRTTCV